MNRARLVKRRENMEREEQRDNKETAEPQMATRTTVEIVKDWVKERGTPRRVDPREQFASLFS
jgi:hypothetical protein